MSIVIVGGGLAGLRTAENLRELGYTNRIVVISDEPHMPYNRPPLSKELLWGGSTEEELIYEVTELAADVEWMLHVAVESVNFDSKSVLLSDGQTLSYEGLVVASGVSSRRLNVPGPTAGRTVVRSLSDAVDLKKRLVSGQRFVSLGAGFIGCEVANTALKMGCDVDIVAIDSVPMIMPLGEMLGAEVKRRHEANGIRFHMEQTIVETTGQDRVTGVVLDDGTQLEADILLETIGSIPNTAWLNGNDLDLSNGVLCDRNLRVGGHTGILAVGDVARFSNEMFDAPPMRIEHWQTAIDTAAIAARTLMYDLGQLEEEPPPASIMPWFWSDQGDVRITSFGMLGLADRTELIEGELEGECVVGYYRGDSAVGVVLLGMKSKAAKYKRWLTRERQSVSSVLAD